MKWPLQDRLAQSYAYHHFLNNARKAVHNKKKGRTPHKATATSITNTKSPNNKILPQPSFPPPNGTYRYDQPVRKKLPKKTIVGKTKDPEQAADAVLNYQKVELELQFRAAAASSSSSSASGGGWVITGTGEMVMIQQQQQQDVTNKKASSSTTLPPPKFKVTGHLAPWGEFYWIEEFQPKNKGQQKLRAKQQLVVGNFSCDHWDASTWHVLDGLAISQQRRSNDARPADGDLRESLLNFQSVKTTSTTTATATSDERPQAKAAAAAAAAAESSPSEKTEATPSEPSPKQVVDDNESTKLDQGEPKISMEVSSPESAPTVSEESKKSDRAHANTETISIEASGAVAESSLGIDNDKNAREEPAGETKPNDETTPAETLEQDGDGEATTLGNAEKQETGEQSLDDATKLFDETTAASAAQPAEGKIDEKGDGQGEKTTEKVGQKSELVSKEKINPANEDTGNYGEKPTETANPEGQQKNSEAGKQANKETIPSVDQTTTPKIGLETTKADSLLPTIREARSLIQEILKKGTKVEIVEHVEDDPPRDERDDDIENDDGGDGGDDNDDEDELLYGEDDLLDEYIFQQAYKDVMFDIDESAFREDDDDDEDDENELYYSSSRAIEDPMFAESQADQDFIRIHLQRQLKTPEMNRAKLLHSIDESSLNDSKHGEEGDEDHHHHSLVMRREQQQKESSSSLSSPTDVTMTMMMLSSPSDATEEFLRREKLRLHSDVKRLSDTFEDLVRSKPRQSSF